MAEDTSDDDDISQEQYEAEIGVCQAAIDDTLEALETTGIHQVCALHELMAQSAALAVASGICRAHFLDRLIKEYDAHLECATEATADTQPIVNDNIPDPRSRTRH